MGDTKSATQTAAFKQLKASCPQLTVGMLTADLSKLGGEIKLMEQAGVGLIHVDVMDGCFCPMMTVGPPTIKAIKTPLLTDVHLMIDEPLEKLDSFVAAGADMITVQVESSRHIHRVLQAIGEKVNVNDPQRPILRGLGLNPGTSIDVVRPLLDDVDMVLLLAVNPGWSGQSFISHTETKLAKLKDLISTTGRDILTILDGGAKKDNIEQIVKMGPDIIVTGSAVFDGKTPLENARFMLEAVSRPR